MVGDAALGFLFVGLGSNYLLPILGAWRNDRLFWSIQATQVVFGLYALAFGLPGVPTTPTVAWVTAALFFAHGVQNQSRRMKLAPEDDPGGARLP